MYIEHFGGVDLNAMYQITTAERMLQSLVVEYEKVADPRLPACSRKAGQLLETCCTIMDMKGVGLSKASSVYSYLQKASAISQNYYPERLGKLYVVNAPWGFSTVFSVVKGFLDPVTVQKIHILGSNYQAELLKQVSPENLPEVLGGSCHCDGGCMLSDAGPWREKEWARPAAWEKEAPAQNQASGEAAPAAHEQETQEGVKPSAATASEPKGSEAVQPGAAGLPA